ncbi:hypothetical protein OX284_010755 [Flavobacterium sp. SUN046]|uniref:hypothetical protein n=1 Tax=Flavobacterium sp. SUN046 TaxID=3002440 RepID=UPI002DBBE90E|nr:hypothetical protein [Flavobacterium sp. SUN046]MEC4049909.1 hypothetical protein [Flavobacterium sp. SUN046]
MKTLKDSNTISTLLVITSFVLFLLTVTSCAKKITFLNSSVVPAARGEVAVKKDKNNNYDVQIQLSYLAEPERLEPPKKTYVVWLISDESDTPINLGQVVGTSKLNVKFETVSSSKPKRIFITAEDDASIQYPGNMVVLETTNF